MILKMIKEKLKKMINWNYKPEGKKWWEVLWWVRVYRWITKKEYPDKTIDKFSEVELQNTWMI